MKLLFDQNISFRILKQLQTIFPDAKQVRDLQLENVSDLDIWTYAKEKQYTIVTFDSDFYDLSTLYGHPPKIIWMRIGNTSTDNIAKTLKQQADLIKSFISDNTYKDIGCLEIDK